MNNMNKTQQKAYDWLLTQGYTSKDIVFQPRKTPDFLTSDGKGWEAKMLYGKSTVWFFDKQISLLSKLNNTFVLVFESGSKNPISIITNEKIIGNAIIDGIRIISVEK